MLKSALAKKAVRQGVVTRSTAGRSTGSGVAEPTKKASSARECEWRCARCAAPIPALPCPIALRSDIVPPADRPQRGAPHTAPPPPRRCRARPRLVHTRCLRAPADAPARPPIAPPAADAETLPGISEPFPGLFDPANFLSGASVRDVRRWRESELVHGRVAMLASLGFVIGENLEDFPAFYNFDGRITGPAIYQFQQVEARGAIFWEPLVIAIGLAEVWRVAVGWATPTGTGFNALKDDYEMGNLLFDPLNLKPSDPEEYKIMQTKEINNGRLAMIAIAAFTAQELVNGREIFEHLFVGIENEILAEEKTVVNELGLIQ
ncbi:MAG: chlorophyll a/b-binding protein domain-containing protein [Monoraphidium minutum]|nr:MAG: chlorophyll a/b-binding protein domain-containing protein [Monoraphidium minutum]